MNPLPGIPLNAWRAIPRAKQRLATEGPLDRDHPGVRDAVLILAAELRLHHIPQERALEAIRAMPLDVPPNKERHYRKQFPAFVSWAYNPSDGLPVLTGCPRARNHSGHADTSRLRSRFEPYCDEECAKTCAMRRGNSVPATVLIGSPFVNVWESSIWADRGLGTEGKLIYERLAALAALNPDREAPVWAARRFLLAKLGFTITQTTISRRLRVMKSLGLITLINQRRGFYHVHVLTDEQVDVLESHLGTNAVVAERERDAQRESLAYAEWTWEWEDAEELVAGTGFRE